jgi:homoserine kinase
MTVSVYAPASIGNVSVGFDLLGAAVTPADGSLLGDVVTITGEAEGDYGLELSGPFKSSLPQDKRDNIVYQCCVYFREQLALQRQDKKEGQEQQPFLALNLEKNLPVGSGLGSSATSIVAALHALNVYFELPFSESELLAMMGHFEGQISGSLHYDNVAPCYLGGIQLMNHDDNICQSLPVPANWFWVMAYSGINVSTKMAREVLPKEISMSTGIEYARNLAVFVDALHRGDSAKAAKAIVDPIAEPYRKDLLPGFTQVSEKLKAMGALATGISGSGPTMFAIADSAELAEQLKSLLLEEYIRNDDGFCLVCNIDTQGARQLS